MNNEEINIMNSSDISTALTAAATSGNIAKGGTFVSMGATVMSQMHENPFSFFTLCVGVLSLVVTIIATFVNIKSNKKAMAETTRRNDILQQDHELKLKMYELDLAKETRLQEAAEAEKAQA